LREVFPETAEQRCWFTIANVLAALPKPPHPGAKKALARDLGRLVLLARTDRTCSSEVTAALFQ
jgi:hypothetical protein